MGRNISIKRCKNLARENRSRHTAHDEMPSMDEMGRTKYDEMKDGKMGLIVLKDIGKRKVSF